MKIAKSITLMPALPAALKSSVTAACLAFAAGFLASPCVRAQASAENPYRAVAGPQADAEMALVQARKLTENKQYSQKITAAYQAIITTLQEVRNAEKTKAELDQNKALIDNVTTEEQAITANSQYVQTRIPALEANCQIAREQIASQQAIFTSINSLLDLFKKSEVDVETLIPLYNQVIENVKKVRETFQKSDTELKTFLARAEEDLAREKSKFGRK
jgi:lipopolysaccharide export LptBFGC system permease protein LptF